jgi:uncharacterized protein YrrD
MQLDMGSQVRTSDGKDAGKVKRIIFDGDSMSVRQFVVHEGIIFSEERMVDIGLVDHVDNDHTVHLNISEEQVDDLTPYVHAEVMPVKTGDFYTMSEVHDEVVHPGSVPWDLLVLTHGTEVYDKNDKHIGHLDEVVYEEGGHASNFIVEAGHIFTHDVKVPITAVTSVTHGRVTLNITSDEAERLGGDS